MHNCVTSHLWLKSALHASSHPCMCTCVLRLGCFLLACPVLYFVPPFSFQPFLMFTSEFNERSRSNPLCDFRLGTVATSDHETPLTLEDGRIPAKEARKWKKNDYKKRIQKLVDWFRSGRIHGTMESRHRENVAGQRCIAQGRRRPCERVQGHA